MASKEPQELSFVAVSAIIDVKIVNSDDNLVLPNDAYDCDIWAVKCLSDGMFLVVDHGNEKLKRLDSTYKLVDALVFENIRAVCEIQPGQAAVGMMYNTGGLVHIINIGMSMVKAHCFQLEDVCRSLTYAAGRLFVCHSNYVGCYSLQGDYLLTIKHDIQRQNIFTSLWSIDSHGGKGGNLYIADDKKGLVIMNTHGRVLRSVNNPEESLVLRGISVTSTGHVFVCDRDGNSVLHLLPNGIAFEPVLRNEDDTKCMTRPRAVCFGFKQQQLLIVCSRSSLIHILDIDPTLLEKL